jgi:uncharacterized protein YbjT (DUF2867 family)
MLAVFGADGRVGGAAVRELLGRGVAVRAVVRDAARGAALSELGAQVVVVDLRQAGDVTRAVHGVEAVLVMNPMLPLAADAATEMRGTIEAIATGLRAGAPDAVLAISDYGAQLDAGTGITMTFHGLEGALAGVAPGVMFLRSAEHMHNWSRLAGVALETGVLPSLHQPLTKVFPLVAAPDVGVVAAELLRSMTEQPSATRIVHVEGPRRYSALDVAATLSELTGREIAARALPRSDWVPALARGGLGTSYAELVAAMIDAHNAGRIDVDDQADESRRGPTELREVLASQLA